MPPRFEPTAVLPFEGPEAQQLQWLPLAMRYKLDVLGLRLTLAQWQALSLEERRLLVTSPVDAGSAAASLRRLLLHMGAAPDPRGRAPDHDFDAYLAARQRSGKTASR
ncbi:MAG TPA: nitrate reductase associated protein [Ramlibacter sp.]|nr:nitrate reductase associated protein [Ramlibacter sp.]